jgi:hypothetical protein
MKDDDTVHIVLNRHGHVISVWANGDRAAEVAKAKNGVPQPAERDGRPFKVEPWVVRQ